jgi:TIR domain
MAGSDWAHGMQQAATTAERLVVVLSAAYLQSGHGEAEWRTFYGTVAAAVIESGAGRLPP